MVEPLREKGERGGERREGEGEGRREEGGGRSEEGIHIFTACTEEILVEFNLAVG